MANSTKRFLCALVVPKCWLYLHTRFDFLVRLDVNSGGVQVYTKPIFFLYYINVRALLLIVMQHILFLLSVCGIIRSLMFRSCSLQIWHCVCTNIHHQPTSSRKPCVQINTWTHTQPRTITSNNTATKNFTYTLVVLLKFKFASSTVPPPSMTLFASISRYTQYQ